MQPAPCPALLLHCLAAAFVFDTSLFLACCPPRLALLRQTPGNPKLARQALVVALSVVFVMVCCFNALLWLLRNRVADVFTDDAAVANMVSSVVPVMCLGVIGDGEGWPGGHDGSRQMGV